MPIATLSDRTRQGLRSLLGDTAGIANPVDVAGATDADPSLFAPAAELLATDHAVGLILLVGLYGGYHLRFDAALEATENETSVQLAEISRKTGTPLIIQSCYTVDQPECHDLLRAEGIPVLASIDHAVRAAAALQHRGHILATASLRSDLHLPVDPVRTLAEEQVVLSEPEARKTLADLGIDLGPWAVTTSPDDLAGAIDRIGSACAVKVVSPQVVHKSDAGGVELSVTPDTAADVWRRIHDRVVEHVPDAHIHGLLAGPMAPHGVELLVGATVDPIFGPIVTFGSGGVLVEALRDVTFRAAPFTHLEAHEMIDETIIGRMLDGYRHLPPVDRDRLADFLVRIGDAITDIPGFAELDLNPVIATGEQLLPVDVRLVVKEGAA